MGVAVRDICLWPVMEGRALTAGIMGLVRRARFLLVTPALLETLSPGELRAVVAHECGHVRHRHLWLYLLVLAGFALLAQALMPVTVYWLLGTDSFYRLVEASGADPGDMLSFLGSAPLFAALLVYFRFLFGFFMRNFERQADLAALEETGDGRALAAVLDKIALLAGNIRDQANWHHFGIGERIEFLLRAEADPGVGRRHHLKVRAALAAFVLAMAAGVFLYSRAMPALARTDAARFSEAVVRHHLEKEPDNPMWLLSYADLLQDRHREREALAVYERALKLAPDDPEVMNNLAWLLLTARIPWIRDGERALVLARRAAAVSRKAYILDTLALACFVNGRKEEAVRLEDEAIRLDPAGADYYEKQKRRFGGRG
jgi:predicted Zn-dependent protease